MDDEERAKLEESQIVPVMFLHLEEARRYAPDDIGAEDLQNLIGPISNRVQDDVPWSEAIEQAVKEYLAGSTPEVKDADLPADPYPKGHEPNID